SRSQPSSGNTSGSSPSCVRHSSGRSPNHSGEASTGIPASYWAAYEEPASPSETASLPFSPHPDNIRLPRSSAPDTLTAHSSNRGAVTTRPRFLFFSTFGSEVTSEFAAHLRRQVQNSRSRRSRPHRPRLPDRPPHFG